MQGLLIAIVYALFGKSILALRMVWVLMGALTCGLAYLLGRRLVNPVVGAIAGTVLAIYPYYIYLSAMFEYPQTVFIFLMALCFLGLVTFDVAPRLINAARRWSLPGPRRVVSADGDVGAAVDCALGGVESLSAHENRSSRWLSLCSAR